MEEKNMLLQDFKDPIFEKRNNRKAVWLNRYLVKELDDIAKKYDKTPEQIAEYILSIGIHTKDKQNISLNLQEI